MNKRELHKNMMNSISKSLKSVLNEGTYVMTPEDEEYLKQAFIENEDLPEVCYFLKADGIPAVLDSEYNDDNLSIESIADDLTVMLTDGRICDLREVLNDEDDVETLHNLIIDYADISESHKLNRSLSSKTPKLPPITKENYPHIYKTINEIAVVRQIEHAR